MQGQSFTKIKGPNYGSVNIVQLPLKQPEATRSGAQSKSKGKLKAK